MKPLVDRTDWSRVQGSECRVQRLGFRVWGLGLKVYGLVSWECLNFKVQHPQATKKVVNIKRGPPI